MSTAATGPVRVSETSASTIAPATQRLAKLVGFLYVAQMALAIFGDSFVRRSLIVPDAAQTAANILANERLFRVSIITDLLIYATVVVLFWGIYVILKPVNRDLALLGAFLRIVENAILAMTTLTALIALRLLSGAGYLRAVPLEELQVHARVFLAAYGSGLFIGFIFLGLGTAVFSYVWLKSGYIPRPLAWLGIIGSLLLSLGTAAIIIFPPLGAMGLAHMLPLGLFEVGLGFWLMFKGLRAPTA